MRRSRRGCATPGSRLERVSASHEEDCARGSGLARSGDGADERRVPRGRLCGGVAWRTLLADSVRPSHLPGGAFGPDSRCRATDPSVAVVYVAARCASSRASRLPRSSRGSSRISPPAQPAASTTPVHRRSVRARRNPAPPITDLTPPTGVPRPRCASPAALRPTAYLTRSHHCRLHQIASPRPKKRLRSHRRRPHFLDHTATPPTTQIDGSILPILSLPVD